MSHAAYNAVVDAIFEQWPNARGTMTYLVRGGDSKLVAPPVIEEVSGFHLVTECRNCLEVVYHKEREPDLHSKFVCEYCGFESRYGDGVEVGKNAWVVMPPLVDHPKTQSLLWLANYRAAQGDHVAAAVVLRELDMSQVAEALINASKLEASLGRLQEAVEIYKSDRHKLTMDVIRLEMEKGSLVAQVRRLGRTS